jgi:hypothetical protein
MYSFSFLYPVSTTYAMPGIVIDVSAILVATMIRRISGAVGAKILA